MQQGVEAAGPCARNATTAQERDQRIGLVGGDPAKRPAGDVNTDIGENPPAGVLAGAGPAAMVEARPCAGSASAAAVAIDPWRKRRRLPEIIGKVVAGNTEIGSGAGPEIFPRAGKMGWKADSAETQVNGLFCPRRCGGGVRRAKCVDPPPAPMQQGRVARLKSAAIPAP